MGGIWGTQGIVLTFQVIWSWEAITWLLTGPLQFTVSASGLFVGCRHISIIKKRKTYTSLFKSPEVGLASRGLTQGFSSIFETLFSLAYSLLILLLGWLHHPSTFFLWLWMPAAATALKPISEGNKSAPLAAQTKTLDSSLTSPWLAWLRSWVHRRASRCSPVATCGSQAGREDWKSSWPENH